MFCAGEGWYMSVNIGSVSVNPPGCVGNFLHGGVEITAFFAPFHTKNDHFAKTSSGTNTVKS